LKGEGDQKNNPRRASEAAKKMWHGGKGKQEDMQQDEWRKWQSCGNGGGDVSGESIRVP